MNRSAPTIAASARTKSQRSLDNRQRVPDRIHRLGAPVRVFRQVANEVASYFAVAAPQAHETGLERIHGGRQLAKRKRRAKVFERFVPRALEQQLGWLAKTGGLDLGFHAALPETSLCFPRRGVNLDTPCWRSSAMSLERPRMPRLRTTGPYSAALHTRSATP